MARKIKGTIYMLKEPYRVTKFFECEGHLDFAQKLCKIKGICKPALYWFNMDSGTKERISYQDLGEWIQKHKPYELYSKFRKRFM